MVMVEMEQLLQLQELQFIMQVVELVAEEVVLVLQED